MPIDKHYNTETWNMTIAWNITINFRELEIIKFRVVFV